MKKDIKFDPIFDRLFSHLEEDADGCWLWHGQSSAYGLISFHGKGIQAHRLSYLLFVDDLPTGQREVIRHTCNKPGCANPAHLIKGTHSSNAYDFTRGNPSYPELEENIAKLWVNRRRNV